MSKEPQYGWEEQGKIRVHLLANVTALVDPEDHSGLDGQMRILEVRIVPMGADYVETCSGIDENDAETLAEAQKAVDLNWEFAPLAQLPDGIVWEG